MSAFAPHARALALLTLRQRIAASIAATPPDPREHAAAVLQAQAAALLPLIEEAEARRDFVAAGYLRDALTAAGYGAEMLR